MSVLPLTTSLQRRFAGLDGANQITAKIIFKKKLMLKSDQLNLIVNSYDFICIF